MTREWKPLYLGVMAGGGAYAEDLGGALDAIAELRREVDRIDGALRALPVIESCQDCPACDGLYCQHKRAPSEHAEWPIAEGPPPDWCPLRKGAR